MAMKTLYGEVVFCRPQETKGELDGTKKGELLRNNTSVLLLTL